MMRQRQQESQTKEQRRRLLNSPLISQYLQTDPHLPHVQLDAALVRRFSSDSLHSFSFAFISQNSISARLDILKRSLEFLRDNPTLANMSHFSGTSSTTALEGFFKNPTPSTARQGQLRSSASSAALSILSKYPSMPTNSPRPSSRTPTLESLRANQRTVQKPFLGTVGEPASTVFDNKLTSVLTLLENAHVFPVSRGAAGSAPKTDMATFHLQSQLLDALATPYYDPSWMTLIQRAGSSSSIINTSASTVDLKSLQAGTPVFSSAAAILHPLSSKYTSHQAVFTTAAQPPFPILASNDVSQLVFGMSKAEIRRQTIADIVRGEYKSLILQKATDGLPNTTLICGELVPIVKTGGATGLAAFFAKKHNSGIIAWVIEEVAHDECSITVDLETGRFTLAGPQHDSIFPFIKPETSQLTLHDIIHGIPRDLRELAARLRQGECHTEHHIAVSGATAVPVSIREAVRGEPSGEADSSLRIRLISIPHVAGTILLDPATMTITAHNASVVHQIFGYDEACVGWPIDTLVPGFTACVGRIEQTCGLDLGGGGASQGLVVPEHLFRKVQVELEAEAQHGAAAPTKFMLGSGGFMPDKQLNTLDSFMGSTGIHGRHKDGLLLTIDVQLRVIGDGSVALWVTYSRNIVGEEQVPLRERGVEAESETGAEIEDTETEKDTETEQNTETEDTETEPERDTEKGTGTEPEKDSEKDSGSTPYSEHLPALGARRHTKHLSDFKILKTMGEGAYGKVVLAEGPGGGTQVVIKSVVKERILSDTWASDAKLGSIPNEIKVMAAMSEWPQANVIQLFDFFEDADFFHVEMEPHGDPGFDLFDLIEMKQEMGEATLRELFRQVLAAVVHLHEHDIVHRDIKDENVIVDLGAMEGGDCERAVKLIDFGSSAFTAQGPFDLFVGTLDYAAPEVLAGQPYEGRPQDVWALGILLYTLVYKENPFYNVDEIMERDLRVPFVLSRESIHLVMKMLTRNVRKRPTAREVWEHPWVQGGRLTVEMETELAGLMKERMASCS